MSPSNASYSRPPRITTLLLAILCAAAASSISFITVAEIYGQATPEVSTIASLLLLGLSFGSMMALPVVILLALVRGVALLLIAPLRTLPLLLSALLALLGAAGMIGMYFLILSLFTGFGKIPTANIGAASTGILAVAIGGIVGGLLVSGKIERVEATT